MNCNLNFPSTNSDFGECRRFAPNRNKKNAILSIILFLIVFPKRSISDTFSRGTEALNFDAFYQRYPAYPGYCSSPPEISSRSIPPLNTKITDSGDTSPQPFIDLVQVNTIIRHGQRTPWSANLPCWSNYKHPNADTSEWNCELTTWMTPPRFDRRENYLLFQKKYDALSPPLGNLLGGTCQVGQLLVPGYEQEMTNGRMLRQAYFGSIDNGDVYEKNHLFLHSSKNNTMTGDSGDVRPYEFPFTVYRADDQQRTLMSGQVLLRALFHEDIEKGDAVIDLHTADMKNDVLHPNEQICPTLTELRKEAEKSEEFQKTNSSSEVEDLRRILKDDLGSEGFFEWGEWNEPLDFVMDCMMTTICTDKTLPDILNDFGLNEERKGIFERIVDYSTWKEAFHMQYNDAEYAKLAMGPLWREILNKIAPLQSISASRSANYFKKMAQQGIPRLALYSGHDTTLLPLLISLGKDVWNGIWPPYASMMVIEVYTISDPVPMGPLAFRLVYNGEVITDRIDLCPDGLELCSLDILFQTIGPFASNDRPSCAVDLKASSFFGSLFERTSNMWMDSTGKYVVLMIAVGSGLFGWFVTYVALLKKIPFKGKRRPLQYAQSSGETETLGGHQIS